MINCESMINSGEFETVLAELRPRLRLHCYRMVGSLTDAEDLTQETALRAWRALDRFDGRSSLATWLYRIATNICLDHLRSRARERRPAVPADSFAGVPAQAAVPWLQPYPDDDVLADRAVESATGPEDRVISRDTVRLAFVAAVQYLPPKQRAALLLRDGLGWTVRMCADALETSSAAINSSLQRARATMRDALSQDPHEWTDRAESGGSEELVETYVRAIETADQTTIRSLLRDDVRVSHGPYAGGNHTGQVVWYTGADMTLREWQPIFSGADRAEIAMRPVPMLGAQGVASWVRAPGGSSYQAFGLTALTVINSGVAEIATFGTELFEPFGLSATLSRS